MAAGVQLPGGGETIDLQQQVARLQALLEASRQVHSTIHENEVLEQVLRIVVRELEMDGAAFPSAGLLYGREPSAESGSMLAWPLDDRGGHRMTELVVAPPDGRELTIYESDFIEGLALQAAVALENARFHKRNVEFARVQQDLDAARAIQRSLLPQTLPSIEGYSLAFKSVTCYEVGGDYLDIVAQPDGSLLIAVADVAGKSIPAAMLMATFQASLKTLSTAQVALPELVANMNKYACSNSQGGLRFTTAFLSEYDATRRIFTYINAGHNNPILRRSTGLIERLDVGGLPLGIQPEAQYESASVALAPGDWLIIFTDGLVEAENAHQEEYGETRLLGAIAASAAATPAEMLTRMMAEVDLFVGTTPQHDDVTCLLVKATEQ